MRLGILILLVAFFTAGCAGSGDPAPRNSFAGASVSNVLPQTGNASWYGGKFDGRRTASGEIFDKKALTAAHPSLPFGTYVKVTNNETNRSVIVRINDRFPGDGKRVIDLSQEAFSHLAAPERGVIPVTVELVRSPQ